MYIEFETNRLCFHWGDKIRDRKRGLNSFSGLSCLVGLFIRSFLELVGARGLDRMSSLGLVSPNEGWIDVRGSRETSLYASPNSNNRTFQSNNTLENYCVILFLFLILDTLLSTMQCTFVSIV